MNVLSDFILRVDDAISVLDVNFAAAKEKKAPAKKATKTVKAKAAPKAKAEPKTKKAPAKKTTKK